MIKRQVELTKKQEENTNSLSKDIETINEELGQVTQLADRLGNKILNAIEHSHKGFTTISHDFENTYTKILNAISDHSIFITETAKILDGVLNKELLDYTSCKLGKWFYSNEAFNDLRRYGDEVISLLKDVEPLHKEVHNIAREAIRLKKEDKNDELFEVLNKLANTANSLVSELMKIYIIVVSKEKDNIEG